MGTLSPHWGQRSQDKPQRPRINPLCSEEHVAFCPRWFLAMYAWGEFLNALGLRVIICKMGWVYPNSTSRGSS